MKRLFSSLSALLLGLSLLAQGNVSTRSYRYSDFTDKVTKVVLSGDDLLSGALKQEVSNQWTASAFEFCSPEEFERLKTQDRYYFLLLEEVRFKGEEAPGIQFLSLVKGGGEGQSGTSGMDEVIALPAAAVPGGSGRELVYLGALVRAVQEFTLAAVESEKTAYSKSSWFNGNYGKYGKMMQLYIAQEDLSGTQGAAAWMDEDMHFVPADEADRHFLDGDYNTLVSYVVAPVVPGKGSYCYKMLFEAESQQLFYIARHKITARNGAGFLPGDLKKLARKR